MATLIVYHEVDDVDHWLASPRRDEVFDPIGVTVRSFVDQAGSKRTALILEVPDMDAFQKVLKSDVAAENMTYDGIRRETLVILTEA